MCTGYHLVGFPSSPPSDKQSYVAKLVLPQKIFGEASAAIGLSEFQTFLGGVRIIKNACVILYTLND